MPSPHCCPSRATFFTGLYPSQHGVWNNVAVSNALSHGPFEGVRMFSEDLRDAGYRLYFSGKWHVSSEKGPEAYGFERVYHTGEYGPWPRRPDDREWRHYRQPRELDQGAESRQPGQILRPGYPRYLQYGETENPFHDEDVVNAAVEKLKQLDGEEPYFFFVGPLGPHDPYFVPQRFLDLYDPDEIRLPDNFYDDLLDKPALYRRTKNRFSQLTVQEQKESIRHFYAFCSYEDELFGRILNQVEQSGQMENTLLLYVSDHGDYIGAHGLWAKGLPCFREAYHICSMAGGGVVQQAGRTDCSRISLADWAPTFLELAGAPARPMEGRSLAGLLRGEPPANPRTYTYTQTNGNEIYGIQRAVWNDQWKYVFNTFDYDELYDLEKDPGELHNLLHGLENDEIDASPYGPVVRQLCRALWDFALQHQDNCVNPYIMTALAPYGPRILWQTDPRDQ